MKQYPTPIQSEIRRLLRKAIGVVDGTCAVWLDGSVGAYEIGAIARVQSYIEVDDGSEYAAACAHAMDGVYPLDRVRVSGINDTVLDEVDAIIGGVDAQTRHHAYIAYLMAVRAAHSGQTTLLSPTGSDSVLCTSYRFAAAFDELWGDEWFCVRRGLWGIRQPEARYSRLTGETVKRKAGESAIDAMQRADARLSERVAELEQTVAAAVGVELRCPWLSKQLSGYTASLPASVRYQKKPKPLQFLD